MSLIEAAVVRHCTVCSLCILLFPERCCHTAWYDTKTIQVINCWWFCKHHHVLTWGSFLCWLSSGACSKACPKLILLHRNYDSELSLDAFKLPLHGAAMTIAISKEQISTSLKAFSMISIPRGVKCSVLTQANALYFSKCFSSRQIISNVALRISTAVLAWGWMRSILKDSKWVVLNSP